MAPNLMNKPGFVRAEDNPKEEADDKSKEVIKCRTDFILQNVYSYLVKKDNFRAMKAVNSKEVRVFKVFKNIIEEFRDSYTNPIQAMVKNMKNVTADLLPEIIQSVSAELFCEGVSWSRMIGLFVFIGELTLHLVPSGERSDLTIKIYESFCRHVKETLMGWVEEHGGWEGVECLAVKKASNPKLDANESSDLSTTESSDQVWFKNVATGAFRIVGTLFQLASPHVQSYA